MLRAEGPEQEVKRNVGAMGAKPEPVPQAPARDQHLLKRIPSLSAADARSDQGQMQGVCVLASCVFKRYIICFACPQYAL